MSSVFKSNCFTIFARSKRVFVLLTAAVVTAAEVVLVVGVGVGSGAGIPVAIKAVLGRQLEPRHVRRLAESPNEISEQQLRDVAAVLQDGKALARRVGRRQVAGQCGDHLHAAGRRIPVRGI